MLPSDFPFDKMSAETAHERVTDFGIHLQKLITPIENAVKKLNQSHRPVCLYLVDCCRIAPEGADWQGTDELCFNAKRGAVIFSCKGGQVAIDGLQGKGGPFALEMANQLFAQSKRVGKAILAVESKLNKNYKHDIEYKGLKVLIKDVCFTRSNRFASSAHHLQKILQEGFEESAVECIHVDASTESVPETSDQASSFQSEGFCGAYFAGDISQAKLKIAELFAKIDSIRKKSFSFASKLVSYLMQYALENENRKRWNELYNDVANKSKDVEEMICFFNETVTQLGPERRLEPPMDVVILNFQNSSSSSPFKFIVFAFLQNLVSPDRNQYDQIDLLANAVNDVKCSESVFLQRLDEFIIDQYEKACEVIFRDYVAVPRKSFVCLFKISRLMMTLLFQTIHVNFEAALEVSNTGIVCLFSSFREPDYRFIPLGKSTSISPASRTQLFESMSHLARLSIFELNVLATYENARQTIAAASSLEEFLSSEIHDEATSKEQCRSETGDHYDEAAPAKRRRVFGHDRAREKNEVSIKIT